MSEPTESIFCPQCGHANAPGIERCQRCQARLPTRQLPQATREELHFPLAVKDAAQGLKQITDVEDADDPGDQTASKPRPSKSALTATPDVIKIPADAHKLTIGYDPDNDLVIPRPNISGHHVVLAFSPSTRKTYLRDLNSTNGTTVNHESVACVMVQQGDLIGLGSYTFTLDEDLLQRLIKHTPTKDPSVTQALGAIKGPARFTSVIIGRDEDCDIVLDAPQISRRHVKLLRLPGDNWLVEDLESANGTFLNDRNAVPLEAPTEATNRDILYMGSYRFPLSRVRDFIGHDVDSNESGGSLAMSLDKKIITIGRGPDNDIVLDASQISRHHARILRKDKDIFIEDLASANGTFLNGKRVGRAQISPEDTLSFGTYSVKLDLARGAIQKSYKGDIILQAENIRVDVQGENGGTKRLLDDISFTAYPTEFIGLMGPSGAGKTTLLMSLIGYIRPSTGRTLLNGDELTAHYDRYRGTIGYVPQEDIIHGELTVYEALYYTAKLRLPTDTSDAEIEQRISNVLASLEISKTAHVRIGSPERKGISGGQRKRVNLAMELLTEPSLLCLDEPTSGLASEDAANVMRLLRRLADEGRTILLTIHQPSMQVYRTLDNVIYLADGEQVYYGPTYPDSILYFYPRVRPGTPQAEEILSDPGSCLRPMVNAQRAGEPMETFAARYRQSEYHREYVEDRRKNQAEVNLTTAAPKKAVRFRFHQLFVLSRRYLNIKFKDRLGTAILLCQAPIIAIFVALVFMGQTSGPLNRMEYMPFALFLLVISAIWFGCSNAAREIVAEQAIYRRERMVNLSIPAYVGSKFLVLAALSLAQCMALLGITYLSLDMVGNPLLHLAVLWGCALAATGMGLTLSAAVKTPAASLALVPMLLIPQVILGGAIMPVDRMEDPSWSIAQVTVSRWGFEGALQIEHLSDGYELGVEDLPKPFAPGFPAPPPPPNPLDRFFGDSESSLQFALGVILAFMLLTLLTTSSSLKWRER
jgi:ABC-type multidrug transport system ATPase subunit/predicted component of type VI protein secretion system